MKTLKILVQFLIILSVIILTQQSVFAQTSAGKLAGNILDADTKEPLIGANIVIVGTPYGASTDIEGSYFIINIPPGTYNVKIAYIGYQTQEIMDVRVVSGITKELSVNLKPSTVEMTAVIIEAEKVFFEAKATNTTKVIDADQIASMPVRGVGRVLAQQAGVVSAEGSGGVDGNTTLNVRGGRGGEVLYIVDGIPQNDLYTGANFSSISQNAIEQVSFQIGGFDAKYGQAGSGIVNLTTKSGSSRFILGLEAVSSSLTDQFGYNIYSGNLSGPIIPNQNSHTFFVSVERGWFADNNPRAIGLEFNSDTVFSRKSLPHNDQGTWKYTARTTHDLGKLILRLGINRNESKTRTYIHRYSKWNSEHNSRTDQKNQSYTARLSLPFSNNIVSNINIGFKQFDQKFGDGLWRDSPLHHWGDTTYNKQLTRNAKGELVAGANQILDQVGIFFKKGRIQNLFRKTKNQTFLGDFDFSIQASNHLIEFGAGIQYNILRYYSINPMALALNQDRPLIDRYRDLRPFYFGYDAMGENETSRGDRDSVGSVLKTEPKIPVLIYGYLQDRYELRDLVINIGLRVDYIDTKADVLKNELLPFAEGNTKIFDDADFKIAKPEVYFSPRIGLGFPVTSATVFHAQYGVFIQQPRLIDVYTSPLQLQNLANDDNLGVNTGTIKSERTTQYELGFRQILGDNRAAFNLTAFYKNTRGLVNQETRWFQRQPGGQLLRYYGPANADFGTVRGLAFSLDVARTSYVSLALNYTYSFAEGTGSSTNSSYTAAFRNNTGEVPKVIAPLDFDQRHTLAANISFTTLKNELGPFENMSVNVMVNYNSGRPYTPLESQNLVAGITNYGETRGYVNSAIGPSSYLVNLKVEKTFISGFIHLTPYLLIENLFDVENAVNVYQSTGNPYTTGYLLSDEGKKVVAAQKNPSYYTADYQTYEKDPSYFGIPRQIRLGMRMNFDFK